MKGGISTRPILPLAAPFPFLFLLLSLTTHAQSNPRDPGNKDPELKFQYIEDAPYQAIPPLPPLYPKGESLKDLGFDSKNALLSGIDQASPIESIAYSPNGRFIASGSLDNTVRIWDVEKKAPVHAFKGHEDYVSSVAFSPNGRFIASGSWDTTVRIWDVEKQAPVHAFKGHEDDVYSVAYSPNGRFIASGSFDKTVRIWDVTNKTETQLFLGGGDNNWLTVDAKGVVLRGEDGTWIRQLPGGRQGPLVPGHMATRDNFSVKMVAKKLTFTPEQSHTVEIQVTNQGAAPAYWLHVDTLATDDQTVRQDFLNYWISSDKKGEQPWKPQRIARLAPGETASLWVKMTQFLKQQSAFIPSGARQLKLTVVSANGTSVTKPIPVTVLSPNLVWSTAELNKDDNTLKALFKNIGKAQLKPSTVALYLKPAHKERHKSQEPISQSRQSLPIITPGRPHEIAFVLPKKYNDQLENLVLVGQNDGFPRFEWALSPQKIIRNVAWLYWTISAVLLVGLLVGAWFFRRYRHPLVVRLSENPKALLQLPQEKLADARIRLLRTDRLDAVLSGAEVSKERFEESLMFFEVLGRGDFVTSLFARRLNATTTPADTLPDRLFELTLSLQFPLNLQKCFIYLPGAKEDAALVFETLRQIPKTNMQPTLIIGRDSEFQQTLQDKTSDRTNKWVAPTGPALTHLMLGQNGQDVLAQILSDQLSLVQLSPYQLGGGVNREAVFFGRQEKISHIVNREPANYLVVSGRQLGKSSLLKALQRRYDSDHPNIHCHYFALSNEVLVPRLARALGLESNTDLDGIAKFVAASSRHHVFLIDEADAYIRNERETGYQILGALRQMSEEGDAHFILAGFWELYRHAVLDYQSPLRNFGQRIDIGALEKDACHQLATIPMKRMGLSYAHEALVNRIIDATGRRANLIAIACNNIVSNLRPTSRVIEEPSVTAALYNPELKKTLKGWESLDDDAHSCNIDKFIVYATVTKDSFTLDDLATQINEHQLAIDGQKLDDSLERLELAFVIEKENGRYTYRVPLMVELLREESPATKLKMVVQALKGKDAK